MSARLRRNTKVRGFKTNLTEEVSRLRQENEELRRRLHAEHEANGDLVRQVEESKWRQSTQDETSHPRGPTRCRVGPSADMVIKHMGRMVMDDQGHGKFAGSTTGVYFVLSVQQALMQHQFIQDRFPESCYRLYLLSPASSGFPRPRADSDSMEPCGSKDLDARLHDFFKWPMDHFIRHITLFNETWSSLCPFIIKADLIRYVTSAKAILQDNCTLPSQTLSYCFQMIMITLLNAKVAPQEHQEGHYSGIDGLAFSILPRLVHSTCLLNLQGLAVFSFYVQVAGNLSLMPQVNGALVRMAHSIGLHRHARRFKLCVGQVELRKRLWWYIYTYDKRVQPFSQSRITANSV